MVFKNPYILMTLTVAIAIARKTCNLGRKQKNSKREIPREEVD
jgi:hypothetical protein